MALKDLSAKLFLMGTILFSHPVNSNSTETNVVNVTDDSTLTWNWEKQYFFNANSTQNGAISGSTNGWYSENSTNLIEAVPNKGSYFSGWSGSDVPPGSETNNPLEVILDSPKTNIVANFKEVPKPYIYSFSKTSLGITNLISDLNYEIEQSTNLLEGAWDLKLPFKATDVYTNIPITITNNPEFLRVKYAE